MCMYVRILYICTSMVLIARLGMYARMCVCMCILYTYVCIYVYIYICMILIAYQGMYVCMHVCMFILCIYICMYVYMYKYVCMYVCHPTDSHVRMYTFILNGCSHTHMHITYMYVYMTDASLHEFLCTLFENMSLLTLSSHCLKTCLS